MAGRYLDTTKVSVHPMSSRKNFADNWWTLADLNKEEDNYLEVHSDGPSVSNYPDTPYLFSSNCNRAYFTEESNSTGSEYWHRKECEVKRVVSVYPCVFPENIGFKRASADSKPATDYMVVIMCRGAFAAGLYKESKLVDSAEIFNRTQPMTAKEEAKFHAEVKAVLKRWDTPGLVKYIRCRKEDYQLFGQSAYRHEEVICYGANLEYSHIKREDRRLHAHIPFVTDYPSLEEVERVNKRLFSIVLHGLPAKFSAQEKKMTADFRKVKNEKESLSSVKDRRAPRTAALFDLGKMKKLIVANNGDAIGNMFAECSGQSRLSEFFSEKHFDGTSCLHFATVKDKTEVVRVLLEFGASPEQRDSDGKLPYELCKTDDMRMVFIEYREKNRSAYLWKRTMIPTEYELKEVRMPKVSVSEEMMKADKRTVRDAIRKKRSQKLNKKNVNYSD